ncbi:MAG: nucleoside-diphosphate sugar epimerase [Verrucomicrobiales bacterium]|nr:nucleoside-diphosphate sugar epimerase [Verrucomicrobiales bacterium]
MKVAITGGTGFIGGHLAQALTAQGHEVVIISRTRKTSLAYRTQVAAIGLGDAAALETAFAGCDAVAHCAGINREVGTQTYEQVHVQGTRNVVNAAKRAGVKKIVFVSFLRARPGCGSPYHESKFAAEEIVRDSGLDYTVFKPGVIYGLGDHMLDHLSHAFHTFPLFAFVGMKDQLIRPTAVADLVRPLMAAVLMDPRFTKKTMAVMGPETLTLRAAVQRVASVVGKRPITFRMPLWFHYGFAWILERLMVTPLISLAQVRILSEGIVEALPACAALPEDLKPTTPFSEDSIRRGLPEPKPFQCSDLRFCIAER